MAATLQRRGEIDAEPAPATGAGCADLIRLPRQAACEFAVVTTRAGFDALEQDWTTLFQRAGKPTQVFQTFGWCRHWCNNFLEPGAGRRGSSLAIVTGRRDGRLVLVLPLVLERTAGLSRLVWLGEPVSQYGDAIVDGAPDASWLLDAAWRHLTSHVRADLVHLRKVRADAAILPLLERIGAMTTQHAEAPFLDLASAATFTDYEQRYSAKTRKNRRRLMRRLEEQGPVAIEQHGQSEEAGALAVRAISMKRAWLDARGILSPALADPRTVRFFADVAQDAAASTGCQVSVLSSSGRVAGAQIGFACKGRLSLHVIVYGLEFEKSGVGVLHLERAITDAYAAGMTAIDLLAPNDAYKMDWADGAIAVDDLAVPLSLAGRFYVRVYLGHLRQRLKSLAGYVPGFARAALTVTTVL